jgi:NAD-dependent DNA ligase
LKDSEVASLSEWLKSNMELTGYYPYDELCTVVRDILRDGKVDDAERKLLKAHLLEYSDLKNKTIINQIQEDTKQINSVGIYTTDAHIEFKEKAFVLSGNFSLGTKSELQSWLESLGGRRTQSVSGKTDYLIVGGGKSDWFYSKHGRKIEAALNLRRAGHQISIIHENDFHDAYQDAR